MRSRRYIFRLGVLLLLGLVVTTPIDSTAQTKPTSDRVLGNYKIVFAGYFTGDGNGVVSARQVIIQGQVTDEAGNTGNFMARCPRNGNHFVGTGSGPGVSVKVKGRLDPSNKSLKLARLSCTYIGVGGGKTGRAAGELTGGP